MKTAIFHKMLMKQWVNGPKKLKKLATPLDMMVKNVKKKREGELHYSIRHFCIIDSS
jgi:hypothetical protein